MNTPASNTLTATASATIFTGKKILLFATIENTSGADRYFRLEDTTVAPGIGGAVGPGGGVKVAAGTTARLFPLDAIGGRPFSAGAYFMWFSDSACTVAAAADANVVAHYAALS